MTPTKILHPFLYTCTVPYFVKQKWTAAFENHVYLNSTEQFPEIQSDDVIE